MDLIDFRILFHSLFMRSACRIRIELLEDFIIFILLLLSTTLHFNSPCLSSNVAKVGYSSEDLQDLKKRDLSSS